MSDNEEMPPASDDVEMANMMDPRRRGGEEADGDEENGSGIDGEEAPAERAPSMRGARLVRPSETRKWHDGLLVLCQKRHPSADTSIPCLFTFCFPCCSSGYVLSKIGYKGHNNGCLPYSVAMCCAAPVYPCAYRQVRGMYRDKMNIEGSSMEDCVCGCCCPWAVASQMFRDLEYEYHEQKANDLLIPMKEKKKKKKKKRRKGKNKHGDGDEDDEGAVEMTTAAVKRGVDGAESGNDGEEEEDEDGQGGRNEDDDDEDDARNKNTAAESEDDQESDDEEAEKKEQADAATDAGSANPRKDASGRGADYNASNEVDGDGGGAATDAGMSERDARREKRAAKKAKKETLKAMKKMARKLNKKGLMDDLVQGADDEEEADAEDDEAFRRARAMRRWKLLRKVVRIFFFSLKKRKETAKKREEEEAARRREEEEEEEARRREEEEAAAAAEEAEAAGGDSDNGMDGPTLSDDGGKKETATEPVKTAAETGAALPSPPGPGDRNPCERLCKPESGKGECVVM